MPTGGAIDAPGLLAGTLIDIPEGCALMPPRRDPSPWQLTTAQGLRSPECDRSPTSVPPPGTARRIVSRFRVAIIMPFNPAIRGAQKTEAGDASPALLFHLDRKEKEEPDEPLADRRRAD